VIFLGDRLVAPEAARIDPSDRGFTLGDGVFETLRAYAGRPFRLDAHLARLESGAAALGIPLPLPAARIAAAVAETLAANALTTGDAAIRITLSRGPGARGLLPPEMPQPTLMITAATYQPTQSRPLSAVIVGIRRNEHSPLSRLKTLNYLDNVLAQREAAERGADEAILLNTAGRLASAARANLFVLRGRTLLTPPSSEGVLPGIARAEVLAIAAELGIHAHEAPLERDALADADEAFLSNSLIEVAALGSIDGRAISDSLAGPLTVNIAVAYRRLADGRPDSA
jgi:branched-chain amino acid aminotransferase